MSIADPAGAAATGYGPLEGVHRRGHEATIVGLEVDISAAGEITRLEMDTNAEIIDMHNQVRLTIFGPGGVHRDQLVELPGTHEWYDISLLAQEQGGPFAVQPLEPGTQVRVAPYNDGVALQSQELLALQVPLDAQKGEGRYVFGHWEAEWPGSLWNSAVVTGRDGSLLRAFAIAGVALQQDLVTVNVFEVGHADTPMLASQPADGAAVLAWDSGGFIGIELTHAVATVPWSKLHEAVLELDARPASDPSADPRRMNVPITAR